MKTQFCVLTAFVFLFSSCCTIQNCNLGLTMVVPKFDGEYILPALPIDRFYVLVNGKAVSDLPFVANGSFDKIECDSDVPSTMLNCCEKYAFHLLVSFEGGATGPMVLDSAWVKIKPKERCAIIDVDPHHNK